MSTSRTSSTSTCATVAVVVVMLLFFTPPLALLGAASIIVIIMVFLLMNYACAVEIGPVVMITAAAAFGMASDAVLHIVHAWNHARQAGGPEPPTAVALQLVGPPVFFSGLTTLSLFLGFLPLVNASSIKSMVSSFGWFVTAQFFTGLLVVPAILSLVGRCLPPTDNSKGGDKVAPQDAAAA